MRITGGIFGGRNLLVPGTSDIRPTQDRVREALFSILQTVVPGAGVLDLFAGTGAFALEALSRGAARATMVEKNPRHAEMIRKNLAALKADATVLVQDAYLYLDTFSGPGFDLVFADPPYALGAEKGYAGVLATLKTRGVVKPEGLFVAEMTAVQRAEETPGWELLRDRRYGKTRICIWRNLNA